MTGAAGALASRPALSACVCTHRASDHGRARNRLLACRVCGCAAYEHHRAAAAAAADDLLVGYTGPRCVEGGCENPAEQDRRCVVCERELPRPGWTLVEPGDAGWWCSCGWGEVRPQERLPDEVRWHLRRYDSEGHPPYRCVVTYGTVEEVAEVQGRTPDLMLAWRAPEPVDTDLQRLWVIGTHLGGTMQLASLLGTGKASALAPEHSGFSIGPWEASLHVQATRSKIEVGRSKEPVATYTYRQLADLVLPAAEAQRELIEHAVAQWSLHCHWSPPYYTPPADPAVAAQLHQLYAWGSQALDQVKKQVWLACKPS